MSFGSAGGAALALAAALFWGGGDFAGGVGVKAAGGTLSGALRVIFAAHLLSLVVLSILLAATHALLPGQASVVWGLGAGVAAALSLAAFYMALARGAMGASAAVSGLLAAAIPALVSAFVDGRPGWARLAGFALAGVSIWLIAATTDAVPTDRRTFALAIAGGFGFGFYFVALRFANAAGVLEPMALARVGSVVTCGLLLLATRRSGQPAPASTAGWISRRASLCVLGVAVLDTGGNLFFIAATRQGRLDAAAVLASLYPASTILLAAWLLHERPARQQIAGMLLALVAVVLVTV